LKIFTIARYKYINQRVLKELHCKRDVIIIIYCLDMNEFNPFLAWAVLRK